MPISRIFKNEDFGYRTITVERPARDEEGKVVLGDEGQGEGQAGAGRALRDTENVPLSEDVEAYFKREVLPHAPDAWIDHEKTKVGYEIPFNRHFYVFKPPRPLAEIDAELKAVTDRILTMIGGLTAVSFPRYPKYKDSGVEWLGEVPEHWGVDATDDSAAALNTIEGARSTTSISTAPVTFMPHGSDRRRWLVSTWSRASAIAGEFERATRTSVNGDVAFADDHAVLREWQWST